MCATSTVNNKAFLDKCDLQIMEGYSRSQVSGKEIYHISPEAQLMLQSYETVPSTDTLLFQTWLPVMAKEN